ncbi:VanZ family protein [Bradyrhizobium genosp. L]|uniref:VanZ family protein n=1 Tax=Bradyrhizobium genosp. L TaxID=83637 RepID=UPI0018A2CAA2|nr:VanZ family protein [Bradyrhizobium genosp. L]QPF87126.1 VanZ family protein [Bradyrhizobium genosp. L]
MSRKLVIGAAAGILVLIVFATLSPMAWRPVLISHMESENIAVVERLLAYALMGALIAVLLPRRALLAYILIVLLAAGLEFLQEFRPDRHALIGDGLQKAAGGVIGVFLANLINAKLFGVKHGEK